MSLAFRPLRSADRWWRLARTTIDDEPSSRDTLDAEFLRLWGEVVSDVCWIGRPSAPHFRYLSPAFDRIWGLRRGAVYREPDQWVAALHREDRGRVLRRLDRGHMFDETYRIVRPDGALRWIRDTAVRVPGGAAHDRHTYGRAADVTSAVEAQEQAEHHAAQLRRVQRTEVLGQLAGGLAHDLNNLLTVILTSAERMRCPTEDAVARLGLEDIVEASRGAARLTRQLLALGRRGADTPSVLGPSRVVRRLEPLLRAALGTRARLELAVEDDAVAVRGIRAQLEQVILNLVLNARDALPPKGGTIVVACRSDVPDEARRSLQLFRGSALDQAVIEVADDGLGMDETTQARIFEPFFTTKSDRGGTGLGLATVQEIVRRHGGLLQVESVPDRGTKFTIRLPRATEDTETALGGA